MKSYPIHEFHNPAVTFVRNILRSTTEFLICQQNLRQCKVRYCYTATVSDSSEGNVTKQGRILCATTFGTVVVTTLPPPVQFTARRPIPGGNVAEKHSRTPIQSEVVIYVAQTTDHLYSTHSRSFHSQQRQQLLPSPDNRDNERITYHWGAYTKPLLPW